MFFRDLDKYLAKINDSNESLASNFHKAWKNHKEYLSFLRKIFINVDAGYKFQGSLDSWVLSIFIQECFAKHITRVTNLLSILISRERNGEFVPSDHIKNEIQVNHINSR